MTGDGWRVSYFAHVIIFDRLWQISCPIRICHLMQMQECHVELTKLDPTLDRASLFTVRGNPPEIRKRSNRNDEKRWDMSSSVNCGMLESMNVWTVNVLKEEEALGPSSDWLPNLHRPDRDNQCSGLPELFFLQTNHLQVVSRNMSFCTVRNVRR